MDRVHAEEAAAGEPLYFIQLAQTWHGDMLVFWANSPPIVTMRSATLSLCSTSAAEILPKSRCSSKNNGPRAFQWATLAMH
jgi:hypothetical protein